MREQFPELGMFLSMASPSTFNDGRPADVALFQDWENRVRDILVDKENIKRLGIDFVCENVFWLGYSGNRTVNALNAIINKEVIDQSLTKAYSYIKQYEGLNE